MSPGSSSDFNYQEAFCRNIGVLTPQEQHSLHGSTVALAGLGGVGGIYALALARMGVGGFHLADGDRFELANLNRQMGATLATLGQNKAQALRDQILLLNPSARVTVWARHLDELNLGAFLEGTQLVIDGMETFAIDAHRLLCRRARQAGLPLLMAAPLGFTAAMVAFHPSGMDADTYFDWGEGQEQAGQLAAFVAGLAPKALHLGQIDVRSVEIRRRVGPSNIAACLLCAGLIGTEAARILTGRGGGRFAPCYLQVDAFSGRLRRGRLRLGNRGWWQRLKRRWLEARFREREEASPLAAPGREPAAHPDLHGKRV